MVLSKLPSPGEMWVKHEELVLEVFVIALKSLHIRKNLPDDEIEISEILSLETRKVNFILNQKGRGLIFPPKWESPKQPASESDLGQSKSKKIPDFSCPFRNNAARCANDAYIDYHIECKRLGKPPSSGWYLTKEYVINGIFRFLDPQHKYGEGTYSGAMIGYVQNMNLREILKKVNKYIQNSVNYILPQIKFFESSFNDSGGIAKTVQKLDRIKVSPSSFNLHHLWVDLRK